jgi:hypothetical protein
MWHAKRMKKPHTEFWFGNMKEKDHLEDIRIDGKIISKWI